MRYLGYLASVCTVLVIGAFSLHPIPGRARRARRPTRKTQSAPARTTKTPSRIFRTSTRSAGRYHFDAADLPPPKSGPIVSNRVLIVPYAGQAPQVPPGFTATPFATGLVNPRRLLVLPNGDVLVSNTQRTQKGEKQKQNRLIPVYELIIRVHRWPVDPKDEAQPDLGLDQERVVILLRRQPLAFEGCPRIGGRDPDHG